MVYNSYTLYPIAMIMTFVAFHANRLFGWLMVAFTTIILIGSVYLGWHYAVDGFLSLLTTPLIWKFSGYLLRAPLKMQNELFSIEPMR